jgi:hypothetical protein
MTAESNEGSIKTVADAVTAAANARREQRNRFENTFNMFSKDARGEGTAEGRKVRPPSNIDVPPLNLFPDNDSSEASSEGEESEEGDVPGPSPRPSPSLTPRPPVEKPILGLKYSSTNDTFTYKNLPLEIYPRPGGQYIRIQFEDDNGSKAKEFANALVEAFNDSEYSLLDSKPPSLRTFMTQRLTLRRPGWNQSECNVPFRTCEEVMLSEPEPIGVYKRDTATLALVHQLKRMHQTDVVVTDEMNDEMIVDGDWPDYKTNEDEDPTNDDFDMRGKRNQLKYDEMRKRRRDERNELSAV